MVLTNIRHVLTICYQGAKRFQSNPPLAPQESPAYSTQVKKWRPSKDPAHVHPPMRGESGIGPRQSAPDPESEPPTVLFSTS